MVMKMRVYVCVTKDLEWFQEIAILINFVLLRRVCVTMEIVQMRLVYNVVNRFVYSTKGLKINCVAMEMVTLFI